VNGFTKRTIALPILCLAACTGSLFQSKAAPPTVYLLSPLAGSPAAAPAAETPAPVISADLTILRPRPRPGLESDRISVLYPDRHLDYFAGARWSGPLAEVLQDLAVQEFRDHGRLHSVSAEGTLFASAYWLEIEVADFQAEYASAAAVPTAHVHFLARLGSSGDRRILGQFEANVRQPAAENRLTAIVDAYARAADAAWGEIIVQADETLAKAATLAKASEAR
jgi:cholesterol transport system auxiliary component